MQPSSPVLAALAALLPFAARLARRDGITIERGRRSEAAARTRRRARVTTALRPARWPRPGVEAAREPAEAYAAGPLRRPLFPPQPPRLAGLGRPGRPVRRAGPLMEPSAMPLPARNHSAGHTAGPLTPADDAFAAGLLAQRPHLARYARRLTRNGAAAEDLVQDTLLRALDQRGRFNPGSNMTGWLRTMMHNLFINGLRRQREAVGLDEAVRDPPFGVATAPQEAAVRLREMAAALRRLEPERRRVLLLRGVDGLAYDAIADTLGIGLGTVKSRLCRSRTALRDACAETV